MAVRDEFKTQQEKLEEYARQQKKDQEEFITLARDAWDKPWWRKFIATVQTRRDDFLQQLVAGENGRGHLDQRQEDRLRGQISELQYILSIDILAKEKEKKDGSGR